MLKRLSDTLLQRTSIGGENTNTETIGTTTEEFIESKDEERFKTLCDTFHVMDASLDKYSKTCASFVELTGLMQEGLDQITGDLLSFCNLVPENLAIQNLESEALSLRDSPIMEDLVNQSLRQHLLGPLAERLEQFKSIKQKLKELAKKKREYTDQRKRTGKLRADRRTEYASLVVEENALAEKKQAYDEIYTGLEAELDYLYVNRDQILGEPFHALCKIQSEFMLQVSSVLDVSSTKRDESLPPPAPSTHTSRRHGAPKSKKDFRSHSGRRLFERPAQFNDVKVQQTFSTNYFDTSISTYERVRLFIRSVNIRIPKTDTFQEHTMPEDVLDYYVRKVQHFFRVIRAQREAKQLASQILAVHTDPSTRQKFWSNPHSGLMSWHAPLFWSE